MARARTMMQLCQLRGCYHPRPYHRTNQDHMHRHGRSHMSCSHMRVSEQRRRLDTDAAVGCKPETSRWLVFFARGGLPGSLIIP